MYKKRRSKICVEFYDQALEWQLDFLKYLLLSRWHVAFVLIWYSEQDLNESLRRRHGQRKKNDDDESTQKTPVQHVEEQRPHLATTVVLLTK